MAVPSRGVAENQDDFWRFAGSTRGLQGYRWGWVGDWRVREGFIRMSTVFLEFWWVNVTPGDWAMQGISRAI